MTQLKAFVGHSFLTNDESTISTLLNMLRDISALMTEFEWDHARAAEPKELSVKVREKMEGKNLFIGICTSREFAIPVDNSRTHWWLPRRLLVENVNVERKASDWILQEIGMAVGRNMSIVLLLEEGVRKPGGLQGDLEYISFKRDNPAACFSNVVSMLRTLSPRAAESSGTAPSTGAASEVSPSPSEDDAKDVWDQILEPETTWDATDYVVNYRLAIRFKRDAAEEKIRVAFEKSPFHATEQRRAAFEASGIEQRAETLKTEWLDPLMHLVSNYPVCYGPHAALADRYADSGEHELAAQHFAKAAELADVPSRVLTFQSQAAVEYAKAGLPSDAELRIHHVVDVIRNEPALEIEGLGAIISIWSELKNNEMYFATSERYLELAPEKGRQRFSLAHKYSELKREADALFHYRQHVLSQPENPGADNNLGVAAEGLKLPTVSIDAYRRASDAGNSLATSNLAYALTKGGFVDEAIKLCEEVLAKPDSDFRLSDAHAAAQRAREQDQEKEARLIGETDSRRKLYRHMGSASLLKTPEAVPTSWKGADCELTAKYESGLLTLVGTYVRVRAGLLALAGFGVSNKEEVRVEYSGRLRGLAFVGSITVRPTDGPTPATSLLGSLNDPTPCVGYLNANMSQFEMLEADKRRYTLMAISV